jgi:hypothetical protein
MVEGIKVQIIKMIVILKTSTLLPHHEGGIGERDRIFCKYYRIMDDKKEDWFYP